MKLNASHPGEEMYCPGCENTFYDVEYCPSDGAKLVRLVSQPDQLIGRTFDGRYTIVEKLGEGGMGSVYRSRQHSFGREVAIKVVNPGLVTDAMIIKRFLREAKLSSRLSHPNAVAVVDFGQTDDGIFYLVMELVNGRTLHDALSQTPQFTPERVVRIGTQICDALECAHDLGIVHRDLKPSNVMLLTSGRDLVKVLDFGLAKSLAIDDRSTTMTGTRGGLMGTPAFVAPELALGRPCDHRADLYSLGCILYLIGSGWPPFSAENGAELISKHAYEQPTPMPNAPPALAAVVMRLLAKSPADRFASAAETRQALEDALLPASAVSSPVGSASVGARWPRSQHAVPVIPSLSSSSLLSLSAADEAPMMLTDDVTSVSVRAESPTRVVHQRRLRGWAQTLVTFAVLASMGAGGAYWFLLRKQAPAPPAMTVQQIFPDPVQAAGVVPVAAPGVFVAPGGAETAGVAPVPAASSVTADAATEPVGDAVTGTASEDLDRDPDPAVVPPLAPPGRLRSSRPRGRRHPAGSTGTRTGSAATENAGRGDGGEEAEPSEVNSSPELPAIDGTGTVDDPEVERGPVPSVESVESEARPPVDHVPERQKPTMAPADGGATHPI
jgi:eukaryotic-like serine/threonine-protein kinase